MFDIRTILDRPFMYDLYHDIIGREKKFFVRDYIGDVKGKKILDVGCGTAQILRYIDGFSEYSGFDMSEEYIAYARKKYGKSPNVKFKLQNINDVTADEYGKYDIVLMMGIMMNLSDDEISHIMKTLNLLLKDDGRFLSFDSVYLEDTKGIAKFMLDYDRGHHLRDTKGYLDLMNKEWSHVSYDIRLDMLRVPYSEILFTCTKDTPV